MKRRLKTLLALIAIFLLPTIWLLMSHFIAKRALEKYKAQLRAAGEKLTIAELQPSPIPPELNGAKLIERAYYMIFDAPSPYTDHDGTIETNLPPAMRMIAPGKAEIGWREREIVSADKLYVSGKPIEQSTNSWADIGQELKIRSEALDLLHQASTFPRIDFQTKDGNMDWDRMYMVQEAAAFLWAATLFDLHRGDAASSTTNLNASLALMNAWSWSAEPGSLSQIGRMAMVPLAAQVQWEALQATNLTEAELTILQHDWESMDCVRHFEHSLEMERASDEVTSQALRASNSPAISSMAGYSTGIGDITRGISLRTSDILWRISWSYRDELRALQREQATIDCVRQIQTNGCFKDAVAERDRKLSAMPMDDTTNNWLRGHLEDQLAAVLWNSVDRLDDGVDEILVSEAARRITMTAIALKRYQLHHGAWPANLKALVSEFLSEVPRDPVDGLPLRYHPNADGTFTLYSIGSDNKDDSGDLTPATEPGDLNWLHGHDWVWPQPATPEEIQKYYTTLQQPTSVYK